MSRRLDILGPPLKYIVKKKLQYSEKNNKTVFKLFHISYFFFFLNTGLSGGLKIEFLRGYFSPHLLLMDYRSGVRCTVFASNI